MDDGSEGSRRRCSSPLSRDAKHKSQEQVVEELSKAVTRQARVLAAREKPDNTHEGTREITGQLTR